FLHYLRTDPRFYHRSTEALLSHYRDICKRIDQELPRIFRTLPRNTYGVREIPRFAAALGVTPATASDAVHALARKGLVTKARAANDRRALAVSLTPAGRREAERVAEWPDFLAAAASTLSPEEQAVFLRAMVKLIWRLQQRGEISVARMCLGCVFFQPNRYPDPDRPHHCAFTGAPFGDRALRLDCADYQPAAPAAAEAHWVAFSGGH
ncbi:MAG: MarR family transcriptional regulator, partial [Chloroflexi bacterium]|nr:MarR family transcriptional regulator [Chloroflexota bacterium]